MPKARKSSSRRRRTRFEEKYSHTIIPLRIKRYLPRMNALLETELINYDELERQIYEKLEDLGVSSEEWPFYMAYAKRVFETYLRFWNETAEDEVALIRDEFVKRRLDPNVLDQLTPICRSKAQTVRGK